MWTYDDLNGEVCRMATALKALGVVPGDIVLFRCRNLPLTCAAILATYKIGAITALTSTLLRESELALIVESAEPKVAVTLSDVAEPLRALAARGKFDRLLLLEGDPATEGEVSAADCTECNTAMPTADTAALDAALLFYSSGTTGKPKGVVHGHRWIAAMGDVIRLQMAYAPGDVTLTPGEFSFMATWGHCLMAPLYAGATAGLYAGRPSPRPVLEAVDALGVNKFMAVPTFYRTIVANADVEKGLDLSRVDVWVSGGEALGESAALNWKRRFGKPLYDMYGITEMQVVIGCGPGIPDRPGSAGRVLPGVRVSLRDDELNEVPVGEPGRVMVHRSDPGLFLEYYKDPDKWRAAHRGNFYDTGDVMRKDDEGYLSYVGRVDDLFKSRGMFISPGEIEDSLLRHPGISEAAVVGLPDERIGYRIAAFAVLATGRVASPEFANEVLKSAAEVLAAYKVPQTLEFVEALPKSIVGKIVRRALRDRS